MGGLVDRLVSLPGPLVYAAVAALVLAEDALFIGFVVPGETAALIGGVTAALGHTSLTTVVVLVVLAAIIGDSIGYEVGSRLGPRLTRTRALRRHTERLDRAQELLAERGGRAVFLGRFIAFFRAVMPALAGAAHMPYRRFLAWNAAGGLVWGTGVVLVGYLAGNSYRRVEHYLGRTTAAVAVAVLVVALVVWRVRVARRERNDRPANGSDRPAQDG
ncbi:DedA family protein [Plantactinospora siamensis]|uniref:DedA family protein n=1 Tax=Plantactinospora siamensis TaxID=555372 RepID=A0ABV6NUV0_9ACTN